MISFGPSKAALYFLVPKSDLTTTVNAIHTTFFQKELEARQSCHEPLP
jgi:aspartate kinase